MQSPDDDTNRHPFRGDGNPGGAPQSEGCLGRDRELAELSDLLDDARVGRGSTLVLHGAPGIGKTALLHELRGRAPDFQILEYRGAGAEADLPYAALHELVWPLAGRVPGFPGPAGDALRGLLRLGPPSTDRLALCTAVLLLLATASAESPLLVLVDDADRLDPDSLECLIALSRRATETSMVLLFATRTDPAATGLGALPHRRIDPLDDPAARELAAAHHPDRSAADRQRLARMAAGNPLALTETPAAATCAPPPFTDPEWSGAPHPAGPRLRAAYTDILDALSPNARAVILLIAAAGNGEVRQVRAATTPAVAETASDATETTSATVENTAGIAEVASGAARSVSRAAGTSSSAEFAAGAAGAGSSNTAGIDPFVSESEQSAWYEAIESDLVVVADGRVRLRQDMIRSVVYYSASPAARRAAHRALAAVSTGPGECAQRFRHLSAAAVGPDEGLAVELVTAAAELVRGDQHLAAADLLYRAAMVSPDARAAAVRLARSARAAWTGGDIDAARELLGRAARGGGREIAGRESAGLPGLVALGSGDLDAAHAELDRDLEVVGAGAVDELRFTASRAGWIAGRKWDPGVALVADGHEPWRMPPGVLAVASGLAGVALEGYRAAARTAGERGEISWQALMLAQSAGARLAVGQWDDAVSEASTALALAEPNGFANSGAQALNTLALHAAFLGDREAAERLCERAFEMSRPLQAPVLRAGIWAALGAAALGAGDPELALTRFAPLVDPEHEACHPTFAALVALDAIEAATRVGRFDLARDFAAAVQDWAADTDAPWAVAAAACGRALLCTDAPEPAERYFRAAVAASERSERPFQHARIQLLYGEWLRRTRRRSVAREQLDAAAATFERLGARPWAERARQEADLVDARSCVHVGGDRDDALTPQELRVARLAAAGATNRDIGARLYISHRTVGHHLSRVFAKLGIACRADLSRSPHLRDATGPETSFPATAHEARSTS